MGPEHVTDGNHHGVWSHGSRTCRPRRSSGFRRYGGTHRRVLAQREGSPVHDDYDDDLPDCGRAVSDGEGGHAGGPQLLQPDGGPFAAAADLHECRRDELHALSVRGGSPPLKWSFLVPSVRFELNRRRGRNSVEVTPTSMVTKYRTGDRPM